MQRSAQAVRCRAGAAAAAGEHRWVPALRSSVARCTASGTRNSFSQQKSPRRGLSGNVQPRGDQWALAQTFFLVKREGTESTKSGTSNTCRPRRLRASMCGSAVHTRKAVTSLAYWRSVAGVPSV